MALTCLEAYKRMTGVNNKLCNAILTPTFSNKTTHINKSTKMFPQEEKEQKFSGCGRASAYLRMVSCSRAFLSFWVRTVSARAWKLQFCIHSDRVSDIHLSTNILLQKHNSYYINVLIANYTAMDFKPLKLKNLPKIFFYTCSSNVISIVFKKCYISIWKYERLIEDFSRDLEKTIHKV